MNPFFLKSLFVKYSNTTIESMLEKPRSGLAGLKDNSFYLKKKYMISIVTTAVGHLFLLFP